MGEGTGEGLKAVAFIVVAAIAVTAVIAWFLATFVFACGCMTPA